MKKKKLPIAALLLAVIFALTALSSCGGGTVDPPVTGAGTTAKTPEATSATLPETEPQTEHVHTPKAEYTLDREPTCREAGSRSYHCSVCGKSIPGTEVEIPADPSKHVLYEWDVTPASFWKKGSSEAECSVCGEKVTEELEMTSPLVYVSNWEAGERATASYVSGTQFMLRQKLNEMNDSWVPFYPTGEYPEGNDLLVEFSLLWNETLKNVGDVLTVMHIEDYNLFNISLTDGTVTSRERPGDVYLYPTAADIAVDPSLKAVPIGEYGWHRIGVRIHQDAEVVGGELKKSYIATLYLDGVMVLQVDKSVWVFEGDYGKGRTVSDASLYRVEYSAGEIAYYENMLHNEVRISHEDFFKSGDPAYLVIADIFITRGQDFVEDIREIVTPEYAPDFAVTETVNLPALRYFGD